MTSLSETSIIAGSSGVTSGYTIDQSIRFNDDDSAYMQRTHGAGGNVDLFTVSFWFKRCKLGADQYMFGSGANVYNTSDIMFKDDDTLIFWSYISAYQTRLITSQKFRDPHAWYHVVIVYDSGNAVSNDRAKMYINGERVTDFSTETYPSQNQDGIVGSNVNIGFGRYISYGGSHFDGYLAEMHYINGYDYGPENFGEFKEDTDIWIPKEFEGNYGTGGFKVDGRDSSDLGDDESGQGNDLTTSGLAAHDQVLDSPTNNFCTLTPLARRMDSSTTLSNGNLKVVLSGNDMFHSSFPITEKSYCEVRLDASSNYGGVPGFGTFGGSDDDDNTIGFSTNYLSGRINLGNGGSGGNIGGTVSVGSIIMMALDPDTRKWWVGVDGTWRNSGDPGAGSGEVYQWAADYFDHGTYSDYDGIGALVWGGYKGSANGMTLTWNWGQDSTFGGQETAGSNTDGSGNGSFKYAVPSGFNALCSRSMGS